MIRVKIILCCVLASIQIFGQEQHQHVESDMLEIQAKTFQCKINKAVRNMTVSDFYVNRFPESMKQYRLYLKELDSLEDFDINKHVPTVKNLQKIGLDEDEIEFLRKEYFVDEKYNNYPIVGLEYSQITAYLDWKAENTRNQILAELNIDIPESMTYLDFLKENEYEGSIPLQTDFGIPSQVQLISAFKEMKTLGHKHGLPKKNQANNIHKERYLKKLKLKSIFEYDLSDMQRYKKLDELILDRKAKDKRKFPEMELKSICGKKKSTYSTSTDADQLLKPWRVYNIKIPKIN